MSKAAAKRLVKAFREGSGLGAADQLVGIVQEWYTDLALGSPGPVKSGICWVAVLLALEETVKRWKMEIGPKELIRILETLDRQDLGMEGGDDGAD